MLYMQLCVPDTHFLFKHADARQVNYKLYSNASFYKCNAK